MLHAGDNVIAVHILKPAGEEELVKASQVEGLAVTVVVEVGMLQALPHGMYPLNKYTAGIWQPVHLEVTDPVAVDNVFVHPHLDGGDFDVTIRNRSANAQRVRV